MKRLIDFGSLAGLAIGFALLVHAWSTPARALGPGTYFDEFPVDQPRVIDLSARDEALEDLTARERQDQLRDWLLYAVVSASGLPTADVNQALYGVPPIRHGYFQAVANFEYGVTRSCHLGNGQVVVLLPANSTERGALLAAVADEHRKNLGEPPQTLWVFEYDMPAGADAERSVTLVRRPPMPGADLFTPAQGYYEARITGPEDLSRFMGQIDDLTYASENGGLAVGGRKIAGHPYRGIRVEEIAAIYQSEAKIRAAKAPIDRKIEEFEARWKQRTYRSESERISLEAEYKQAEDQLKEELRRLRRNQSADSTGFSLDPTFDFKALANDFDTSLAGLLASRVSPAKVDAVRAALSRDDTPDADPLYTLLGELAADGESGDRLARAIQSHIKERYGFQAARYDGELRGTETGMVLFYTDLLAKLWALDYQRSASSAGTAVAGFRSITTLPVSSVYRQELRELSNTRLWFGPQDKGFQLANGKKTLLFARTATRVYAAGSNSLKPGVETQANAESAAFLGWWDDHYDEISRYEPEYQRLNEIMKWSLLVGWLNGEGHGADLVFLEQHPVERGNWFPDWLARHPELRYRDWTRVGFYPRGYKDSRTEALPLLSSETYLQFGEEQVLSGGVSLAGERTFVQRAALSLEASAGKIARGAGLEYNSSGLKSLEGVSYAFRNPTVDRAFTTMVPKAGTKLRGALGEVANKPFERAVVAESDSVTFAARAGNLEVGRLDVRRTTNGFRVGWESRDLDKASSLARRLSEATDPAAVLARDRDIAAAVTLPGDGTHLVKFAGSDSWLKLTPERVSTTNLRPGFDARVGSLAPRGGSYNLVTVAPKDIASAIGSRKTLVLSRGESAGRYEMRIGQAPVAGHDIEIASGAVKVRGKLDPKSGAVSFSYDDLPSAVKENPALLERLVAEANPTEHAAKYAVATRTSGGLSQQLHNGSYQKAAREFASSPKDFRARLDGELTAGVDEVNRLLASHEYQSATSRLDELMRVHGTRDDLRLQKVVADLSDRVPGAGDSLKGVAASGKSQKSLLDEINARLKTGAKRPGETISVVPSGEGLGMRYSAAMPTDGAGLGAADVSRMRGYVYVQDTPGLNNLDWSASMQRTLDGAVSGQFKARVIKLPASDVASFRPTVLFDETTRVEFKSVSQIKAPGGVAKPQLFVGSSASRCDQSAGSDCKADHDVYLVVAR